MCSCNKRAFSDIVCTVLGRFRPGAIMEKFNNVMLENLKVDAGMVTIALALSGQLLLIVLSKRRVRRFREAQKGTLWVHSLEQDVAPSTRIVYEEPEIQSVSSYDDGSGLRAAFEEEPVPNQASPSTYNFPHTDPDNDLSQLDREEHERMYTFLHDSRTLAERVKARMRMREGFRRAVSMPHGAFEIFSQGLSVLLICLMFIWSWHYHGYFFESELFHHRD